MQTIIRYYEGSFQFKLEELGQVSNIETHIKQQLMGQHLWRKSEETLWAALIVDGAETKRYSLNKQLKTLA